MVFKKYKENDGDRLKNYEFSQPLLTWPVAAAAAAA